MKKLFALFLLLSACGKSPNQSDPRTVVGVDHAFDQQVATYIYHKGRGLDYDIPIGFAALESPTVGVCMRWTNGYRQIQIDPTYWADPAPWSNDLIYKDNLRQTTISHELGHCDLNREHSPSTDSIMYYMILGSQNFDELFGYSLPTLTSSKAETHGQDDVIDISVE